MVAVVNDVFSTRRYWARLLSNANHVDSGGRDRVHIRNRTRHSKGNWNQLAVGKREKIKQSVHLLLYIKCLITSKGTLNSLNNWVNNELKVMSSFHMAKYHSSFIIWHKRQPELRSSRLFHLFTNAPLIRSRCRASVCSSVFSRVHRRDLRLMSRWGQAYD